MKQYFFVISLLAIICACSSNQESAVSIAEEKQALITKIDSLHQLMFNQQSMELNKEVAAQAISAGDSFIEKFPEDSMCAEYLFRISDLSRAMGDHKKAIERLNRICKEYPNFKKIPECLFLQGYYYQDFLGDTIQAKNYYTELISKYPTHAFADDAQALMSMFGKSEQDIIKGFEKEAESRKITIEPVSIERKLKSSH